MTKAIADILASKPEAGLRLCACVIADAAYHRPRAIGAPHQNHIKVDRVVSRPAATGVNLRRPEGALQDSPGQRPGHRATPPIQALKGRPNPCHNPSPISIFTSSSARKAVNRSSLTLFGPRFTPTWQLCYTTSVAHPCLSIRWRITSICSSIYPAPSPSARLLRMSKKPRPNGSRRKAQSSRVLPGRRATVHLPFQNPTLTPFVNTSPANGNTTTRNRFKKNTGSSLKNTALRLTNGMCGIERRVGSPFQGLVFLFAPNPRATPWAAISRPVGADGGASCSVDDDVVACPVGEDRGVFCLAGSCGWMTIPNLRALPWAVISRPFGADDVLSRPEGALQNSLGQRPGHRATPPIQALKGRPNPCPKPSFRFARADLKEGQHR